MYNYINAYDSNSEMLIIISYKKPIDEEKKDCTKKDFGSIILRRHVIRRQYEINNHAR